MVGSVGVSDEKRNECIKINGMNWKHLQEMNQINYDRQHFQRILFLGNKKSETKYSKNKNVAIRRASSNYMIIVKSYRNVYYMTLAFAYV